MAEPCATSGSVWGRREALRAGEEEVTRDPVDLFSEFRNNLFPHPRKKKGRI